MFAAAAALFLLILTFSFKCEPFILDIVLIIVPSDNFPQDAATAGAAAATVSTVEAASVDGSIHCRGGGCKKLNSK